MYSKQAIVAEPAGALSVSALENYKDHIKGKTVVVSLVVVIMILIE
ncbi:Threonine dehydratase [Staphylococcus aureus]|uniref:Threonine dehydratase n=1 Tax=Staphylococcus aureus TaxID=1280 RepID=A0A380DVG5_STAAU|nr:Threonine dehydratase [Staphylococcus aureus]